MLNLVVYWFWLALAILAFLPTIPPDRPDLPNPLETLGPGFSLRLPDLVPLPPQRLQLLVQRRGPKKVLRFDTAVANHGSGPIELTGEYLRGAGSESIAVTQLVTARGTRPFAIPMGRMIYHSTHAHWHWENFARYEIWSVKEGFQLAEPVGIGFKASFCLRDIEVSQAENELSAPQPVYDSCGWRRQGLSAGWSDLYERHLDGQSLDISTLPDGLYALVITANPDGLLVESSHNNNQAAVFFHLEGQAIQVVGQESKE